MASSISAYHAESNSAVLREESDETCDCLVFTGLSWSTRGDARIGRFGVFLEGSRNFYVTLVFASWELSRDMSGALSSMKKARLQIRRLPYDGAIQLHRALSAQNQ